MTEKQAIDIVDKRLEEKLNAILDKKFQQYGLLILKRFDDLYHEMDRHFEEVDHKFSKLQSAVDGIAARLDTEVIERTALEVHVDRHDRWIKTIAGKTGTTLKQ